MWVFLFEQGIRKAEVHVSGVVKTGRRRPRNGLLKGQTMTSRYGSRILSSEDHNRKSCERHLEVAERILTIVEEDAAHRRSVEMQVVYGDSFRATLGLICGFVLAISALGASTYVIILGHDLAGAGLFGSTLVSIVRPFVYGKKVRFTDRPGGL